MGAIFGYFKDENNDLSFIQLLNLWNQNYGENYRFITGNKYGLGATLRHFSNKIRISDPVMMYTEYKAVIDAVLYNRDEIADQLSDDISDLSDEQVLLKLIEAKGFDALAKVNGDFAGAIFNEVNEEWVLFRDHMGVRPLFYYLDKNIFVFSTDIRGIVALPEVDLTINEELFYQQMMGYNSLSLTSTEFANIFCVTPASWMVVKKKDGGFETTIHTYWKLGEKKIRLKNDTAYQVELKKLITDAIQRRLNAVDGVIGAELSGGWDSSVIAILINRLGREEKCYTWSYSFDIVPMQENDERQVVLDICKQEGIECTYDSQINDNWEENMDSVLNTAMPPYINTIQLSTGSKILADQGAKVIFTGHGGDEGVSHRCSLYELYYHHEFLSYLKGVYNQTAGKNYRILRTVKRACTQIYNNAIHDKKSHFKSEVSGYLNDSFAKRMNTKSLNRPFTFGYDAIAYIMQGGSRNRLDNIALQGGENGVQYMVPFLDYRVIDYAVSIPRAQFHDGITMRKIYRCAFNDIVPDSLKKVDYKDTPSFNYFNDKTNFQEELMDEKKWILDHIDRNYWEEFLNFNAIENDVVSKHCTFDEYIYMIAKYGLLFQCVMIDNMIKIIHKNI